VTFNLQRMVIGELLGLMLVLLVIYGRRRMGRLLYQLRRRSNTGTGASSVLPLSSAARGVLWTNAWKEFANDADFLRANGVGAAELESLKHVSFMGTVTCKEDLLLILEAIRGSSRRQ
jgi:hypothetical protein